MILKTASVLTGLDLLVSPGKLFRRLSEELFVLVIRYYEEIWSLVIELSVDLHIGEF